MNCSRFTDELLGTDKHAKPIGDPDIAHRAKLGAHIGEGNKHFQKYSMTGKVYLILMEVFNEAKRLASTYPHNEQDSVIEDKISRPGLYSGINPFPREYSALRLASAARLALTRFKEDYKHYGFYNLIEWRTSRQDIINMTQQRPQIRDYRTNINDDNIFVPSILHSMEKNSENLAEHLM
jgi:hypothetical protein